MRPVVLCSALLLAACGDQAVGPPDEPDAPPPPEIDAAPVVPDAGLVVVSDPGPPVFPATAGTVSLSVRTGNGANDGTDANEIDVCLRADRCYRLNVADVNDFRIGEMDVYHFYDQSLPRGSIDRVEIRSTNGTDMWRPSCLAIQLDGEPVYCADGLTARFGNGGGSEVESFTDPLGLHLDCASCYPNKLTHGPMIGAVEDDTIRVLVRTDATRRVALRMTDDPTADLASAPTVSWLYPSPVRDYTGVLVAEGATPGRGYRYAVEVDGQLGPPRAVVAAPADGQQTRFTFAFGSCTRLDDQPLFDVIGGRTPDLFLFLGDNHYGNTPDLGGLRWHYRWALERPERATLLAITPTIATWDDHDFVGNNTTGAEPGKDVALRVFGEYWANPSVGSAATPGVFTVYRRGDVEFYLLDDRYWRGLENDVLGSAQTAWLLSELESSTATFKLLASGSQWSANGSTDSWAAFLPARNALFDALVARHIEGVVLLSGDIHRAELRLIPRAAAGGYDLPELTSSPLANTNFACEPDMSTELDLISCFDQGNSFILVDADTTLADPLLDIEIIDQSGTTKATWALRASDLQL